MPGMIASLFEPSARALVGKVRAREARLASASDDELRGRTAELRERLSRGQPLEKLLPEAFACVVEASARTLGMRHFDVQVQGGIELARGRIVEMKTGEGKTLVATLPAYLHALAGRGVHVVTVNDYLASRDAEWMGPVYRFLGLTVGCIQEGMGSPSQAESIRLRKAAYAADVTYVTNSELVFDFLRDNLAFHPDEVVQRGRGFAIVDEVDLLLIDEAQTPLIIASAGHEDATPIRRADAAVRALEPGRDYGADHRSRSVTLTDRGQGRLEAVLGVGSLADPANLPWAHRVYQALQAHGIYERDVQYIVTESEIHIVDEHTGRVSPEKRYSNGLHQALEAKEGVTIGSENRTLAKTSYQYFFRGYPLLCGMTGTAWSEREELRKVYGRKVVRVPTHKQMIRQDFERTVLVSTEEKHEAVVDEVAEMQGLGRPVLVGTVSVDESERLSGLLAARGIPHEVLNARQHALEADVIAQAGRPGAVTISTNMAGRGTDVVLGGNPRHLAARETEAGTPEYLAALKRFEDRVAHDQARVVEAGGLHVIGTGEHESARLDDQLRGRAGRQGDPGSSAFYVSLDDPVYRRFGQKRVLPQLMAMVEGHPEGEPVTDPTVLAALDELRRKVEVENQAVRLDVLKYDSVIHERRESIWGWRRDLLHARDPQEWKLDVRDLIDDLLARLDEELDRRPAQAASGGAEAEPTGARQRWGAILRLVLGWLHGEAGEGTEDAPAERGQALDLLHGRYLSRFGTDADEALVEWERLVLLGLVDGLWPRYLNDLERVQDGIWMRSYAQQDPFVEFRKEAAFMYGGLMRDIELDALRAWLSVEVTRLDPGDDASGPAPAMAPRETRHTMRR